MKFRRFPMIVLASFAPFAGFLTEHHPTIGMSGRNAISMFMLYLYSIQPLHSRVDLVYARGGKTALPLAGEKWGGMVVATAVNKLRVEWQTNQFLASAFPEAAEGFLAVTVGDCVLGMINQPVTPINPVAVKHMILALIEKLEPENRTFTALSNAITSILQ